MDDEKIQALILESISYLQERKSDKRIFPTHILDIELHVFFRNIVNRNLKTLIESDKVKSGDTINHIYYKIP